MEDDESLVEEKEEVMISPCAGKPFKKMAYFLNSNVPQLIQEEEEEGEDGNLKLKLPSLSAKCKWPLEVKFYCWSYPSEKWEEWVGKMHERYHNIWKKCGLDEAILNSVYRICKNEELVLNVAERWCSETSSFLFPWGEATVTLEDVMVLGGFPVLGCLPFSLPLYKHENIIIRWPKKPKNTYGEWLDCFMGSGSPVEHEAFLAMWLSKFVFPGNDVEKINENVFPIAVHLARGTKIALAPAVLAGIYRDLTLLSGTMAEASKLFSGDDGHILEMGLWSPMQLVQIWVWERLVPLRPSKEIFIEKGDPRVSRWHAIEQEDTINMRPAIDSAGEAFQWRPYALTVDNWVLPRYYREFADWLPINGKMNDDDDGALESFAQCLRVCELQGIDCKELYQPHRVAMQFGYDQDIPKWIQRSNEFLEFAWYRPFADDAFLFLPSRLGEADVSYRYMEWWRNRVLVPVDTIPDMKRRARKARRPALRNTLQNHPKGGKNNEASALLVNCTNGYCRKDTLMHPVKTEEGIEPYDLPPPPGFPAKQYLSKAYVPPGFPEKNLAAIVVAPPPGFLPKGNVAEPIYPPGFFPTKNVANLDDLPPPGFPAKKNVANLDDLPPPGFPAKKNVANLDDLPPPEFPPKKNVAILQPKKAVKEDSI